MIVIESTQNATNTSTTALVIDKPTGLAVGDVMIATIFQQSVSALPAVPSGWASMTGVISSGGGITPSVRTVAKTADSSDVAASNFSFPSDGSTRNMAGLLMRVSGGRSDLFTGQPTATGVNENSGSTTQSFSVSLTPLKADSLLIFCAGSDDRTASGGDITAPVISGTNPTWTRQFHRVIGTSESYGTFTAIRPATTQITSVQFSTADVTASTDHWMSLVAYTPKTGASGTLAHFTPNTAFHAPAGRAGVNANLATHHVSPEFPSLNGQGTSPTNWTNEGEASTTWTNENI